MKSRLIALSAISSAMTAIILTLGAYIQLIDVFTIVAASIFVTLPLYYNSFKASLLTYLAGGVIAFMISGFNYLSIVFPSYFLFFGVYPIVQHAFMQKGKTAKILGTILSMIWFIAIAFGLYFFYTGLIGPLSDFPKWILDNIYYFIPAFAIVFYLIFNRFILVLGRFTNQLLKRVIK